MIRLGLLSLAIAVLIGLAFRDWFKSLCGLITMMAVSEHPDMPYNMFGIQGVNVFNFLLVVIIIAMVSQRRGEGLKWDAPLIDNRLLLLAGIVIIVGFVRTVSNLSLLEVDAFARGSFAPILSSYISDKIVNTFKWVIPGLLLFYGARSRSRLLWALGAILFIYLLLGVQIIKWLPLSTIASGEDLAVRSTRILGREIGYHRVDLGAMMAGGSWAVFSLLTIATTRTQRLIIVVAGLVLIFALALTGSRAAYATWVGVGALFAYFRWRKLFWIGPVLALIMIALVPQVRERMLQGFGGSHEVAGNEALQQLRESQSGDADWYTVTSGRTIAWPFVMAKISEAPFIGYGRDSMKTTGLSALLWVELKESFPHPHNAYLELILDNGILGAIPFLVFFFIVLHRSAIVFRKSKEPVLIAAGGVALALVGAQMIAGLGAQSFYPREGVVGMWCGIGLLLRAYIYEKRRLELLKTSV